MNYYYITGTSRGIGKAMVEYLLQDDGNRIIGISRNSSINHKHYTHLPVDLSDVNAVKSIPFKSHPDAQSIVLINNAGAIGMVKPVGKLDNDVIIRDFNLNLIAPVILTNNFIAAYANASCERIIINVSSGAGKNPIDGWSVYCASKSGLDLFSRVVDVEQNSTNKKGFRIFAIAPGVVDTQMQTQIRASSKEDFSRLEDFINYKSTNTLADPNFIAEKYFRILAKAKELNQVVFSVKDIQ